MKQHLLTAGALLLVAASSFAQSRVTATTAARQKSPVALEDPASNGAANSNTGAPQHRNNGINRTNAVILTPIGSTSGNSYGGFVSNKHTFAYNPELNLLVFGHRGGGAAGSVGNEINFDYSTDGGATWTPQIPMVNPSIGTYNTRYPNLCIWNPAGNTNIANAKAVVTGPCTNGTGWQSTYLASASLPTAAGTSYAFSPYATAIPVAPQYMDYASWSMCNVNGGMGYVSARMFGADGGVTAGAQTQSYHLIDFWKITPNATGGFDRSIKFTSSPLTCVFADTASFGYDLAFGPDGNTGYISHATADLDGQRPEEYSRTPVLYKTTDGGENWTKQAGLDLHRIQAVIDSTVGTGAGNTGPERPTVQDTRLVVDNLGRCHMFAEIGSGSSTSQDSTGYSWSGATVRFIMHFIIDGNNVQSNCVYRTNNTAGTFGALTNAFDEQFQAGRSADGTRVFFTTCQTPTVGSVTINNAPNLWAYAYRTTDNKFMPLRDYTTGTDAEASAFFPRLSPVVMNIPGGHKLPITLMTPGGNPIIDTAAPDFSFLDGVNVMDMDYTGTVGPAIAATYNANGANICSNALGSQAFIAVESANSTLSGKVGIMPNPTSGELTVNLTQLVSAATLTVTDLTGRTISTQTNQTGNVIVNLTAEAAGVYFLTIQNEEGRITTKIAVAK